jgi:hypothetical protein
MSQGFCPALLTSINDVAEGNAPGRKMQIAGFLAMLFCCQNSLVNPVNSGFDGPNIRPLTVSYTKRPVVSQVSSTDDCNVDRIPSYLEWTLPNLGFKKSSFFIDDATMAQYCADFASSRQAGRPPTTVMREVYERMYETANVVMRAINQDLVTQMLTRFGVNVTTGQSHGKVINVDQDGAKFVLDNGIIDMLRDIQENEICGDPCLVGGGLWSAWNASQLLQCCNAAGMDFSKTGLPKFFFDKDTQQIWGPDTAGLFAPGSVKFIGRNAYQGWGAGPKGTSFFTMLPMPVEVFSCNADDCLRDLIFDMQMRYIDCPTTLTVAGNSQSVNRGWQVIISKRYALWVQPADAYQTTDPLYDTNGTLMYYLTNQPTDPHTYAYGYPR